MVSRMNELDGPMRPCSRCGLVLVGVGACLALVGVAAGALGAHALRGRLDPAMLGVFETAVRYQMYHALALLAVGGAVVLQPGRLIALAGGLFVAGILMFSGSLYLLSLTGTRGVVLITPLGGVAFIAGWACLAGWAFRTARRMPRQRTPGN